MINIRAEINALQIATQYRKISETESQFFREIIKIDIPLGRLAKIKTHKLPMEGIKQGLLLHILQL